MTKIIYSILLILFFFISCQALPKKSAMNSQKDEHLIDGFWESSTPEAQGIDSEKLVKLLKFIQGSNTGLECLIIIRNEKIILETYYAGYQRDIMHELQSATKSFTSALIGIAIEKGFVRGVDQPLFKLLPEYESFFIGKKRQITLKHLLNMSSGLEWNDWRTEQNSYSSSFDKIYASPDSVAFILNTAFVSDPGEVFFYNTGSSHLLSAIIKYRTGMSTFEFAKKYLFNPLKITEVKWGKLPNEIHKGGWDLYLRPLDMAKFGALYLNKGSWRGNRLINRKWIEQSTKFQISAGQWNYAYHWWRPGGYNTNIYTAAGYKGQHIYVLDELNLVVVMTGGNARLGYTIPDNIMKTYIVPAVKANRAMKANPDGVDIMNKLIKKISKD